MRRSFMAGVAAATLWTAPAWAWNDFGHMEVAAFAWPRLNEPVKAKVGALLKLNPLYDTWTADVPENDKARVAFIMGATWPDIIKGDPDFHNDGGHNGDEPPPTPEAGQNKGYIDLARHKYWHFVDFPFSPDDTPLQDPKVPNAQTQIPILRAALADPNTRPDLKSYDLVWLEHLVGDVHQPLHATSRFTSEHPDGDAGGNLVKVHCDVGDCHDAGKLHSYWDGLLGPNDTTPQAVTEAARDLPKPDAGRAAISDEKVWIRESFELAQKVAYHLPSVGHGAGPFVLPQAYQTNAENLARERVALAGARLANLLNAALK